MLFNNICFECSSDFNSIPSISENFENKFPKKSNNNDDDDDDDLSFSFENNVFLSSANSKKELIPTIERPQFDNETRTNSRMIEKCFGLILMEFETIRQIFKAIFAKNKNKIN